MAGLQAPIERRPRGRRTQDKKRGNDREGHAGQKCHKGGEIRSSAGSPERKPVRPLEDDPDNAHPEDRLEKRSEHVRKEQAHRDEEQRERAPLEGSGPGPRRVTGGGRRAAFFV